MYVLGNANYQYFSALISGSVFYTLILIIRAFLLFVVLNLFIPKLSYRNFFKAIVLCEYPIALSIILSIILTTIFGLNSAEHSVLNLNYYFHTSFENVFLLSLKNMMDISEIWRLLILSLVLRGIKDISFVKLFVFNFGINYSLMLFSSLLISL
jgi:hypothetical protein